MLLVYGVFHECSTEITPVETGMGGEAISFLSEEGLVAAISMAPKGYATPDLPDLMVYAKVIEILGQTRTILPFRYGCLLESQEQVLELLRRRHKLFQSALREVEGCVEMSIRLLLPNEVCNPVEVPKQAVAALSGGAAYLKSRKAYYAEKDQSKEMATSKVQELQSAFSGLFVKSQVENNSLEQGNLVSMYFLVPRGNMERFRETFRVVQERGNNKVLLTGPWPPYNFFNPNSNEVQP